MAFKILAHVFISNEGSLVIAEDCCCCFLHLLRNFDDFSSRFSDGDKLINRVIECKNVKEGEYLA